MNRKSPVSRFFVTAALALAAATAVQAEPSRAHLQPLTPAQLEQRYLQCESLAADAQLDGGSAMHCSLVYEEFKQRVFGGSYERLLAWWRDHGAKKVASIKAQDEEPARSF